MKNHECYVCGGPVTTIKDPDASCMCDYYGVNYQCKVHHGKIRSRSHDMHRVLRKLRHSISVLKYSWVPELLMVMDEVLNDE